MRQLTNRNTARTRLLTALIGLSATCAVVLGDTPIGTVFTYQGRVTDTGSAASGLYDFRFTLWDESVLGGQVGISLIADDIDVVDGRFSIDLDFGAAAFDGSARWLQIDMKADADPTYTALTPRQPVHAAPYAIHAASAGSATDALTLNGESPSFYTDAANLSTGVLANDRLQGAYSNPLSLTNPGNAFSGDGSGLANLDWSALINVPPGFADGADDDTTYVASAPLQVAGTTISIAPTGASVGDILKWNGAEVGWSPDVGAPLWNASGSDISYSAGDVGIGTGAPQYRLHVDGGTDVEPAGGGYAQFGDASRNITIDDNEIMARESGATGPLYLNHKGGDVILSGSGTGNVGIRTNSPAAPLDVRTSSGMPSIVTGGGNDYAVTDGEFIDFGHWDGSSFTRRMRISPTGEVGIGTSAPASSLHVLGSGSTAMQLERSGGAMVRTTANVFEGSVGTQNDTNFRIVTDGGVRMQFNTDGTAGIGTVNPTQQLHLTENLRVDGWIGTDVDAPVEVRVNDLSALRIEYAEVVYGGIAPSANFLGGASDNGITPIDPGGVTIAGGGSEFGPNLASDDFCTIGGGYDNQAGNFDAHSWNGRGATVSGGLSNTAGARLAAVGGGQLNVASATYATIAGGHWNHASGGQATISGGSNNAAAGLFSAVPGGANNQAGGDYSFAAGQRAKVRSASEVGGGDEDGDEGTFVWSDRSTQSGEFFASTGPNQFLINATGGVGINTNTPNAPLDVNATSGVPSIVTRGGNDYATTSGENIDFGHWDGTTFTRHMRIDLDGALGIGTSNPDAHLHVEAPSSNPALRVRVDGTTRLLLESDGNLGLGTTSPDWPIDVGGGAYCTGLLWVNLSSRVSKENFAEVDPMDVLNRLSEVPIQQWNYRTESAEIVHLGPTAEDFAVAFGLGDTDKAIATVDADGVALAAIQGLNQRLNEQAALIARQRQLILELEQRVQALESE